MDVGTRIFVPVSEYVAVSSAPDVSWVHVYSTVDEMTEDLKVLTPDDAIAQGLEFFDPTGRRLVPEMDEQRETLTLQPTADPPNPAAVLERLRQAVRLAAERLRDNPELLTRLRMTLEQALAVLPQLDGVDLATAIRRCRTSFGHRSQGGGGGGPVDPNDPGSVWHVIIVHGLG